MIDVEDEHNHMRAAFGLQVGLSPVGDVVSAVENVSAAYSDTTAALHEYFDHTPIAGPRLSSSPAASGG